MFQEHAEALYTEGSFEHGRGKHRVGWKCHLGWRGMLASVGIERFLDDWITIVRKAVILVFMLKLILIRGYLTVCFIAISFLVFNFPRFCLIFSTRNEIKNWKRMVIKRTRQCFVFLQLILYVVQQGHALWYLTVTDWFKVFWNLSHSLPLLLTFLNVLCTRLSFCDWH